MVAFAGYPLLVGEQLVGVLAMFSRRAAERRRLRGAGDGRQRGRRRHRSRPRLGSAATGARRNWRSAPSELSRLTAALERSNRDLDQFAYVASHDLKAPLRGICSLAQWIEEDLAGNLKPSTREHLTLLRSRVHRMEALIEGILAYSRAGRAGGEQPERVAVRSAGAGCHRPARPAVRTSRSSSRRTCRNSSPTSCRCSRCS